MILFNYRACSHCPAVCYLCIQTSLRPRGIRHSAKMWSQNCNPGYSRPCCGFRFWYDTFYEASWWCVCRSIWMHVSITYSNSERLRCMIFVHPQLRFSRDAVNCGSRWTWIHFSTRFLQAPSVAMNSLLWQIN